jgi:hypothetical protein
MKETLDYVSVHTSRTNTFVSFGEDVQLHMDAISISARIIHVLQVTGAVIERLGTICHESEFSRSASPYKNNHSPLFVASNH